MAEQKDLAPNMDKALQFLLEAENHQIPMNSVINQYDSPIQKFYEGSVVFITGSSGFLGKHLVEKLLRSCQLKKVYVLLRTKKGKSIKERLEYLLKDPLYDVIRKKLPNFKDNIVPVEGDVEDIRLGLCDEDWQIITKEVDTVFHMAATIRFDETLRKATFVNVRGTRETLALAKSCENLKNFVYVSTAFSHATAARVGQPLYEQFYTSPIKPETMIELAETLDEKRLNDMTMSLIQGWPNTYTFTKAIAEELVRTAGSTMPICVVRPPIVVPAYYDPAPGWMDLSALQGPTGILAGIILGILHVFYVSAKSKLALSPVDTVNNATIAAAWDAELRRRKGDKEIPIYTVSNERHFITWGYIGEILRNKAAVQLSTPKAVWYCYLIETQNKLVYFILTSFLHYIPAWFMDRICGALGKMPKGVKSFVDIFKKIDKFAAIYQYFLFNEWGFTDENVQIMHNKMADADKKIYNCNLNSIDFHEYVFIWGLGLRKYIIKDGLIDSDYACHKQNILEKWNLLFMFVYFILFCGFLFSVWKILCCVLAVCFGCKLF